MLFIVLSIALYGVNQKFRESRKGLEHCSLTVQQASQEAEVQSALQGCRLIEHERPLTLVCNFVQVIVQVLHDAG